MVILVITPQALGKAVSDRGFTGRMDVSTESLDKKIQSARCVDHQ